MSDIGGLDLLKEWLLRRGGAFSEAARRYGLPHPRGLLLAGIQGTGKSLTAKRSPTTGICPCCAWMWDGCLPAGWGIGSRTRQMIQIAEALSPCVLWIDEIDKAFAGLDGRGDSGTAIAFLARC